MATLPLHFCHHLIGYLIPRSPVCPITEDETDRWSNDTFFFKLENLVSILDMELCLDLFVYFLTCLDAKVLSVHYFGPR